MFEGAILNQGACALRTSHRKPERDNPPDGVLSTALL